MEAPPFDVASMLHKEFHTREGWKGVFTEAKELARELDFSLPYRVEKEKLRAVNKKLKKFALWSEKRRGVEGADGERRRVKKIKTEV